MNSKKTASISTVMLLAFSILLTPGIVLSADTTEPFEPGVSDVEIYLARDGVGLDSTDQLVAGEIVLGVGLTSKLSGFVSMVHSSSTYLTESVREIGFGLYGTALDTDNLDLDLFLCMHTASEANEPTHITPSFELNWDNSPDQSTWGVYSRAGVTYYGHQNEAGPQRLADLNFTLGTYLSVADNKQILFEYETAHTDKTISNVGWENGRVSFGYNVGISDTMELVNQVSISIPHEGQKPAYGMVVGFITTLPTN